MSLLWLSPDVGNFVGLCQTCISNDPHNRILPKNPAYSVSWEDGEDDDDDDEEDDEEDDDEDDEDDDEDEEAEQDEHLDMRAAADDAASSS